jgi:nucleoid-associated protein YgaU
MKTTRLAVVATAIALVAIPDVIHAQAGHMHRATRRRTAVVVGSAASASGAAQASQAQQQTAAAQQQTVAAQQQAAAAQQQAAAAERDAAAARQALAVAQGVLPLGTVVRTLPAGCTSETVAGVEHYHCGGNYYRAAFEGNNLVYVTTAPKQ